MQHEAYYWTKTCIGDLQSVVKIGTSAKWEYCDDWCEKFRKDNVSLDELSEMTHIPTEVLTAHLTNTHPHPFYVHPLTKQVCLSSPLMNGVIDQYLNKCVKHLHDVL